MADDLKRQLDQLVDDRELKYELKPIVDALHDLRSRVDRQQQTLDEIKYMLKDIEQFKEDRETREVWEKIKAYFDNENRMGR